MASIRLSIPPLGAFRKASVCKFQGIKGLGSSSPSARTPSLWVTRFPSRRHVPYAYKMRAAAQEIQAATHFGSASNSRLHWAYAKKTILRQQHIRDAFGRLPIP